MLTMFPRSPFASGDWPPDDRLVGHTCDNRRCVRADDVGIYIVRGRELPRRGHLFLGTQLVVRQLQPVGCALFFFIL